GTVQDADVRAAMQPVFDKIASYHHVVVSVTSPYSPQGQRFIAPGGKIAYAQIQFNVQSNDVPKDVASHMRSIAKAANSPVVQVELGGGMFSDQAPPASAGLGVLAAVVILLLAFGSVLAMGLPIITALFGIGIGLAIVELLANPLSVPNFAPQVTEMIGLGVGIDYALFISTRYREALHDCEDPEASVIHAIDTSGRAVLFAGMTVVISLMGLLFMRVAFIQAMAIGAALAVLFVMAAAVTLLPAVLGFVGHTIDKFALPGTRRARSSDQSVWARWSRVLQKRPWPAAIGGLLVLVVLALPFFSLRLGVNDLGNDPKSQTTRRSYDLLSQGFGPGFNGPLLIVAETPNATQGVTAMNALGDTIRGDGHVALVAPAIASPNGRAVLMQVVPKGSPQDKSTTQLVHELRNLVPWRCGSDPCKVTPPVWATLDAHVGGQTALGVDLADTIGRRLPYMFLAILLLSFVLLMLVFRSLLVPLKAVIMNLLSIGAAYGVMVAIFQYGWGKGLVGVGKEGPIEAWIPMMLFAIVFGLSMDYEVFLLSRIKEEYDLSHDNAEAVAHGLAKTARLITAAAAIMICVFGSFVLSDLRVLKMIGFGLAFAVFIDATVVRLVLVPATMELLGDRNWWFPKWLDWLPRIHVEGSREIELEPVPALGD
ncbi:MAG TPA: MMPL family transporter, partial [Acidimicrobiia bacterium]|nr:MMPL family transporter [Acidimicrobiia bacterium]